MAQKEEQKGDHADTTKRTCPAHTRECQEVSMGQKEERKGDHADTIKSTTSNTHTRERQNVDQVHCAERRTGPRRQDKENSVPHTHTRQHNDHRLPQNAHSYDKNSHAESQTKDDSGVQSTRSPTATPPAPAIATSSVPRRVCSHAQSSRDGARSIDGDGGQKRTGRQRQRRVQRSRAPGRQRRRSQQPRALSGRERSRQQSGAASRGEHWSAGHGGGGVVGGL